MQFTFENQGMNTYLVYQILNDDVIDSMSLGMLTNNKIPGLASTLFTQMNEQKFVKYNVSAKISVKQFFSGVVNKKRLIGVCLGIVNAMISAEEYMIDTNTILLDTDYIYSDVSTCETVLICLPIERIDAKAVDLGSFFKGIVFGIQYDLTENNDYVGKIINYLNSTPVFSIYDFKEILDDINNNVTYFAQQNSYPDTTPAQNPAVQKQSSSSTINIQKNEQNGIQGNVNNVSNQTRSQDKYIVDASRGNGYSQANQSNNTLAKQHDFQAVATNINQVQNSNQSPNIGKSQTQKKEKQENKSKQSNQFAFDIPGQSNQVISAQSSAVQQNNNAADEKSMSALYLLRHYSKENAEIYKSQKESRKNKKVNTTQNNFNYPGSNAQGNNLNQTNHSQNFAGSQSGSVNYSNQNNVSNNYANKQNQSQMYYGQQNTMAQMNNSMNNHIEVVPATQSYNSQAQGGMDFGNTMVLATSNQAPQTEVLSVNPMQKQIHAYLVRQKNKERIIIDDKEIFRIGAEKSYVDYFVGDNPAVSRSHCYIVKRNDEYYIVDTNSSNHTYVDGSIIGSGSEVNIINGTKIRLANEDFEFIIGQIM